VQTIFSIEMYPKDDEIVVDSKRIPNDDALLPLAREGHAKNYDLRAVIKADSMVRHGRVMHVLDLLKQAGIAKIAFGVTPIAPEPTSAPAPAGPK
jgi:biopolymer transport protein ExbD